MVLNTTSLIRAWSKGRSQVMTRRFCLMSWHLKSWTHSCQVVFHGMKWANNLSFRSTISQLSKGKNSLKQKDSWALILEIKMKKKTLIKNLNFIHISRNTCKNYYKRILTLICENLWFFETFLQILNIKYKYQNMP